MWSILTAMADKHRWRRPRRGASDTATSTTPLPAQTPVQAPARTTAPASEPAGAVTTAAPPAAGPMESGDGSVTESGVESGGLAGTIARSLIVTLFLAAHPKQALVTALALAGAAAASGRPAREVGLVFAAVVVGQTILGWHNDLVDRERDARHAVSRKPIAEGTLDPGTAWFALSIAVLLVIPLSITTGVTAGSFYLGSLVVGILGNVVLRRGPLSFVPWAVSFALYPAYLSYGGFGGEALGDPPVAVLVVLAALLGVGVHFVRAIWGLVADDREGWTYLPLRLGRRLGATRLLLISAAYVVVVLVLVVVVAATQGLTA